MGFLTDFFRSRETIEHHCELSVEDLAAQVALAETTSDDSSVDQAALNAAFDSGSTSRESFAKLVDIEKRKLEFAPRAARRTALQAELQAAREDQDKLWKTETARRRKFDTESHLRDLAIQRTETEVVNASMAATELEFLRSQTVTPRQRELARMTKELAAKLHAADLRLSLEIDGRPTDAGRLASYKSNQKRLERDGRYNPKYLEENRGWIKQLEKTVADQKAARDAIQREIDSLNSEWRDIADGKPSNNGQPKTKGKARR